MMPRERNSFVIPGRVQRVRAKRGPMTGFDANPESASQTNLEIPGPARRAIPE
jgi:hypothetical protein